MEAGMNPALYLPPDYVDRLEALIAKEPCTCANGGEWVPCDPPAKSQPVLYETCVACKSARRHPHHSAAVACEVIAWTATNLWSAANTGNPCPWLVTVREAMANPKPGDLVLELTSRHRYPAIERMGIMREPSGGFIVVEKTFSDGKRETWENCEFITIPAEYIR